MGGGEKKKANNMLDQQVARQNTEQERFGATIDADRTAARGRADEMYSSLYGGYNSLINSPVMPAAGTTAGVGSGGRVPITNTKLGTAANSYQNFIKTGGIQKTDPTAMRSMNPLYEDFSKTGGLDDEAVKRYRGNGVYDEFAETGGVSSADKANLRSRATSVIPAMYDTMKAGSDRRAMAQGGYGPGRDIMMARLGRAQAGAMSDATRNAEIDILDRVSSGRQWGAEGMSRAEDALQGMRTGNMLAGAAGKVGVESAVAQMGQRDQEMIQKGKMFGTSGIEGMGNNELAATRANAAAGASRANAAAADERWRAQFGLDQKLAGLEGMGALYGSAPAEVSEYNQLNLNNRGLTYDANGNLINNKLANNRSGWENVSSVAGAISSGAGAAGGVMSGIGSFRRPRGITSTDGRMY